MTWTQFWSQFDYMVGVFRSIADGIPNMIMDVLFASLSFAAIWVLVKLIREVRS